MATSAVTAQVPFCSRSCWPALLDDRRRPDRRPASSFASRPGGGSAAKMRWHSRAEETGQAACEAKRWLAWVVEAGDGRAGPQWDSQAGGRGQGGWPERRRRTLVVAGKGGPRWPLERAETRSRVRRFSFKPRKLGSDNHSDVVTNLQILGRSSLISGAGERIEQKEQWPNKQAATPERQGAWAKVENALLMFASRPL